MSETAPHLDASRQNVRRLVDEYCANQRHPSLPEFVIHGPFTQDDLWKSDASKRPGCYVIYGWDGSLRYIGMSKANVGARLKLHLTPATQLHPVFSAESAALFRYHWGNAAVESTVVGGIPYQQDRSPGRCNGTYRPR
jgi:hypothetical protein